MNYWICCWSSNHITGTAESKVVKFCTQMSILATGWHHIPQKICVVMGMVTWHFQILPFAVMQRVVRVRQRQLSYLFIFYFVRIDKRPAMEFKPNLASRSEVVSIYKCHTISGAFPQNLGHKKHQILDHFFLRLDSTLDTRLGRLSTPDPAW